MRKLSETVMYQALLNKDSEYDGIFFAGIKTTGIFCRPTCRARKPKKENVEYFKSAGDALSIGYRPCKICRPLEYNGMTPEWLKPLLTEIENDFGLKIKNYELIKRGFDPARVRRWFKKNYNMTFQAYLRLIRLNGAFNRIKSGNKIIESAFDSGYESLSGFTDSFRKEFGGSPQQSKDKTLITVARILTPLGPLYAGATETGLCLLEFADRPMLETQLKKLRKYLNAVFLPGNNDILTLTGKQIDEYFQGKRKAFEIPLLVPGTEFSQKVWKILQTIPYGTTRSYKQQAEYLGCPEAIRAVAKANGENRLAIIIPCHRVIGVDGRMVGYGGGIWRKEFLLNLERKNR